MEGVSKGIMSSVLYRFGLEKCWDSQLKMAGMWWEGRDGDFSWAEIFHYEFIYFPFSFLFLKKKYDIDLLSTYHVINT